jgi:chemosensory pili system protein ChpA (sensor histidine kinase/response regulator)
VDAELMAICRTRTLAAGDGQRCFEPDSPLPQDELVAALWRRTHRNDDIEAADTLDPELFPIFEEEAEELLPQLQMRLREWLENPGNADAPAACMRTLHTFKGGARLAGAMRLGEMAHRLETTIEQLAASAPVPMDQIEPLPARADAMAAAFEALSRRPAPPSAAEVPAETPVQAPAALAVTDEVEAGTDVQPLADMGALAEPVDLTADVPVDAWSPASADLPLEAPAEPWWPKRQRPPRLRPARARVSRSCLHPCPSPCRSSSGRALASMKHLRPLPSNVSQPPQPPCACVPGCWIGW